MDNSIFQRYEIKFLVSSAQRKRIEEAFRDRMVPDSHGESTICNVYYDTPDYRLIRSSLEKPVYKEKLRMRSYGPVKADDTVFLELKKKYKGVVYKRRIELPQRVAADYMRGRILLPDSGQIGREIDYFRHFYARLRPAVYLSYDRCAWYERGDPNLRVTFDRSIAWRQTDMSLRAAPGGKLLLRPDQSLLEIKTAGAIPLWLVETLDACSVRQASFSKYGEAYKTICQHDIQERIGVPCA